MDRERKLQAGKKKFARYMKKKHELDEVKIKEEIQHLDGVVQESRERDVNCSEDPASKAAFFSYHNETVKDCSEGLLHVDDNALVFNIPGEVNHLPTVVDDEMSAIQPDDYSHSLFMDSEGLTSREVSSQLEEYRKKLLEYQGALTKRDGVITQLTERLSRTIEQRDVLQNEASTQADNLAAEIETLKLQLQQANEILLNQKGKNGISAQELLEARNIAIAVQREGAQKEALIQSLKGNLADRDARLNEAKGKFEAESRQLTKDAENMSLQLKSWEELIQQKDADIQMLEARLEQQLTDTVTLREIIRSREDECQNLQTELCKLMESKSDLEKTLQDVDIERSHLTKKDSDNLAIQKQLREEAQDAISRLQISADALEKSKQKSSEEIKSLMEQLETMQKKLVFTTKNEEMFELRLDKLRAELDETHGNQIVEMKEVMRLQHQADIQKLTEDLASMSAERDLLKSGGGDDANSLKSILLESKSEIETLNAQLQAVIAENSTLKRSCELTVSKVEELQRVCSAVTSERNAMEEKYGTLRVEFEALVESVIAEKARKEEENEKVRDQLKSCEALRDDASRKLSAVFQHMNDLGTQRGEVLHLCKNHPELEMETKRVTNWSSLNYESVCQHLGRLKSDDKRLMQAIVELTAAQKQQADSEANEWKAKYEMILQEKLELEVELQTTHLDTGIMKRSAYVCGGGIPNREVLKASDESQRVPDAEFLLMSNQRLEQEICDLKRKLAESAVWTEPKFADSVERERLECQVAHLKSRLQDEESVKATLESAISNLQKMCKVYEKQQQEFQERVAYLESQLKTLERQRRQRTQSEPGDVLQDWNVHSLDVEKSDSIKCECHADVLKHPEPLVEVASVQMATLEDALEDLARVTSEVALERAQGLDKELTDVRSEMASRYEEAMRSLREHYEARLEDLRGQLQELIRKDFEVKSGDDGEEEREKLLREVIDLRTVLGKTEAMLRDSERRFMQDSMEKEGSERLENEKRMLEERVLSLEKEVQQSKEQETSIRQELQAQYEEDVEHIRGCLEASLAHEAQSTVEAEVDRLKERVEADVQARYEENSRLSDALQQLKVQVEQLHADKERLERAFCGNSDADLDEVRLSLTDINDDWAAGDLNSQREDVRLTSTHLKQLLIRLISAFVRVTKSVNKELFNLFGSDLDVGDENATDDEAAVAKKSEKIDAFVSFLHLNVTDIDATLEELSPEIGFTPAAGDNCHSSPIPDVEHALEELVTESEARLTAAVRRLLDMLAASIQQLQESQGEQNEFGNMSQQSGDELAQLIAQNEELSAQLRCEIQTKERLASEIHTISERLRCREAEKTQLEEVLDRKEKQVQQVMCQLEESQSRVERLEDSLVEDQEKPDLHQEQNVIAEGAGKYAQMVKPLWFESHAIQAAASDSELMEENTRLLREKRGLQHRGEKDRSQLNARIHELEQTLEELTTSHSEELDEKRKEIADLQQQIDAMEKQLRGYKQFIEEQTAEREQERDEFQHEMRKLADAVREKDRAQGSEERLTREVEVLQEQVKEKDKSYRVAVEKREQLERELAGLTEISNTQQDVIRELERQLDCKSRNERELGEQMEKLKSDLFHTTKLHEEQYQEIEELRKASASSRMSGTLSFIDEYLDFRGMGDDPQITAESFLLELRSQIHGVEEKVIRHARDLEGMQMTSSSLSSPCSEEVSVREQLDALRNSSATEAEPKKNASLETSFASYVRDVRRLEEKVETLSRGKDMVLKRTKDLEAQLAKQKQSEEELLQDREVLQQKLSAQLVQISGLQARIEERRLGMHSGEAAEKMAALQEELQQAKESVEEQTKKIEHLQEALMQSQKQCDDYKIKVNDVLQQYSDVVHQAKASRAGTELEINDLREQNQSFKCDAEKTEKKVAELSSLLQTIMKEKNTEIDNMKVQLEEAEQEREKLRNLVSEQEETLQKLKAELDEKESKIDEKNVEAQEKLVQVEKELKKSLDTIEQKRREVEALKVVLEEKAQLVEQVKTLRSEIINLSNYQARLQEDFDMVQAMLEERQAELTSTQQELADLTAAKEADQESLKTQLEDLQQQVSAKLCPGVDQNTQTEDEGRAELWEKTVEELESRNAALEQEASELQSRYERDLVTEKQVAAAANQRVEDALKKVEKLEDAAVQLTRNLEQSREDVSKGGDSLKVVQDELNQASQQRTRLEAEVAWRDAKIFRLEDELEQWKSSDAVNRKGKALHRFLEEVRSEIAQEDAVNQTESQKNGSSEAPCNLNGNIQAVHWKASRTARLTHSSSGDDGQLATSTDASISESDADSSTGESVPPPVKSLMRKVYKEGIHVLNLSELQTLQEHADGADEILPNAVLLKAWENERRLLVLETQRLKELLSQITTMVSASRSDELSDPVPMGTNAQLLRCVSDLLTTERDALLSQIKTGIVSTASSSKRTANPDHCDKLEKMLNELGLLYENFLLSLKKLASAGAEQNRSVTTYDDETVAWEVQMAVAKERLKHQEEQKKLMHQVYTVEQQMAQNERQVKRQAELLEFRVQQEQIIAEDLRHSLDMEKSRSIELCSQLSLEKGRASQLELTNVQCKSELMNCQMALDQVKQELRSTIQLYKNEKARAESLVHTVQHERESFAQLQEAMEAEKRRSKTTHQREQQIIDDLRRVLESERDKQVELTGALRQEKLALQNAQRGLRKVQDASSVASSSVDSSLTTCVLDDSHKGSSVSNHGTIEDIHEALELERRKNHDLSSVLQKEHHRLATMTAVLQQERRQLLEELEVERNNMSQLQSKCDMLQRQKAVITKELQREKEQVDRLECDHEKLSTDFNVIQEESHQKQQEIEALRQIQRNIHKEWEVEREQERHKQQELRLEVQRLQQKVAMQEKELEFAKRNDALCRQQQLTDVPQRQSHRDSGCPSISSSAASRYQAMSLETVRQRLHLLILKVRDELDKLILQQNVPKFSRRGSPSISALCANTTGALLTEVSVMAREAWSSPEGPEGTSLLDLTEKIVRHNADLAEFAMQLNEEKLSLRKALLESQGNYERFARNSLAPNVQPSVDPVVVAERAAWAQERASLLRALHRVEAELVRGGGELRASRQSRFMSASPFSGEEGKANYYYCKYLRAQSYRKNLIYQKNYLLILLGGYQDTEAATLDMLGRLGCLTSAYGSHQNLHHSKAFRRFRSVVRVVSAVCRMRFLVRKWNRSIPVIVPTAPSVYPSDQRHDRDDCFDVVSQNSSSVMYSPSVFSQCPVGTPPVRDTRMSLADGERSDCPAARRSLSRHSGSTSSSANSIGNNLNEYVQRFETIRHQLGIGKSDVGAVD